MAWTDKQEKAIKARGTSLIVSAAAGSGKTSVLVERLVKILMDDENKISADSIVVVTFTNDAASEIKNRLNREFRKRIKENPGNTWLRQQQILLHKAKISTIHAFCYSIIREYINDDFITSNFRVLDETEYRIMQKDAADIVFNSWIGRREDDMNFLLDCFCSNDDEELEKIIVKDMDDFLSSVLFKEKWFEKAENKFKEEYYSSEYYKRYYESIATKLTEIKNLIEKTIECSYGIFSDNPDKVTDIIFTDLEVYRSMVSALQNNETYELCRFKNMTSAKKNLSDVNRFEMVKEMRERYKAMIKESAACINDFILYGQSDYELQGKIFRLLRELYTDYTETLWDLKQKKNALSFSDAEEQVLDILCYFDKDGNICPTETALEISSRISIIMIDEYQDSNNKQDIIFKLLSGNNVIEKDKVYYGTNAFIVGDAKQSIYSFRQANPENFISTVKNAPMYKEESENRIQKIYLNKNFRSSDNVVDFVNYVFEKIMSEEVGDVVYNEDEMLYAESSAFRDAGKSGESFKTKIIILNNEISEAEAMAKRISRMIREKAVVYDKDGNSRPCRPGDFCILLRKKKFALEYEKELTKLGIPVDGEEESGYLESREVAVLLNMLKVIDNPSEDLAMASVLMSPMFMFSADDMLELREINKKSKLIKCIRKAADESEGISERLNLKCCHFIEIFEELRQYSIYNNITLLVQKIYEVTDYLSVIQRFNDGDRKRANLRLMYHYTQTYTQISGSSSSLSGFMRYIEKIGKSKENFSQAASSVSENAVHIKTIHKSKGLEYSFVFLAENEVSFSKEEAKKKILMSEDSDVGFRLYDPKNHTKWKTFSYNEIQSRQEKKQKSEEMRLLYVALTRARQQIFIPLFYDEKKTTAIIRQNNIYGVKKAAASANSVSDWIWLFVLEKSKFFNETGIDEENKYFDFEYIDTIDDELYEERTEETEENVPENFRDIIELELFREYDKGYSSLEARKTVSSLTESDEITGYGGNPGKKSRQWKRPSFIMENEALTGNEKGTAVHNFFQYINYENAEISIDKEKKRLVNEGYITEKQCSAVSDEFVQGFLDSDIYKEMKKADPSKIEREKQILVKIDDILQKNDFPELEMYRNSDAMLKGVIDLYFEDSEGNIILIDYKTDKMKKEDDFIKRYKNQLALYAAALECITGKKADNIFIYSFVLSRRIRITK